MKRTWILKFFLLGLLALAVIGFVTQLLWNWLIPVLFAGPAITFWQALGLIALSKILFWSFGKGGRSWNYRGGPGRHWAAKWDTMNPEDRERFKEKMKEKWCRPANSERPEGQNPGTQA